MARQPLRTIVPSPEFEGVIDGTVRHQVMLYGGRVEEGSRILIQEADPDTRKATGRSVEVDVTYVTSVDNHCALSAEALSPGMCIASIVVVVDSSTTT